MKTTRKKTRKAAKKNIGQMPNLSHPLDGDWQKGYDGGWAKWLSEPSHARRLILNICVIFDLMTFEDYERFHLYYKGGLFSTLRSMGMGTPTKKQIRATMKWYENNNPRRFKRYKTIVQMKRELDSMYNAMSVCEDSLRTAIKTGGTPFAVQSPIR